MTWQALAADPWFWATVALVFAILFTVIPLLRKFTEKIELSAVQPWFHESDDLGDQKERVINNFERIRGSLVYWKKKAAAFNALDDARVFWSIISSVTLPVLVQVYDSSQLFANVFFTSLTVWTGGLVTYAYTVKAEQKYQGFRAIESDYYDASRDLLDFAKDSPDNLNERVDHYIRTVAKIREMARDVETGRPASAKRIMG
jgi:hypothetical protein